MKIYVKVAEASNAEGSRIIIVHVQVIAVKIYVKAVEALT